MDLLERDAALADLTVAWTSASRGEGRAGIVSGEPGIGKTALVRTFLSGLGGARVLMGACDDLSTPRPLGPVRDMLGAASPELRAAIERGSPGYEIHELLLAELRHAPRPTVLVIEDAHWADDATLEAITMVGRRIGSLPAVLIVTFRGGEVAVDHPLRAALGSIPPGNAVDLQLQPLTAAAVATLASTIDAATVHRLTGGNPFYVTELLAAQPAIGLPPSVATAVLARASRLDRAARDLLELVAMVPGRIATGLLDALRPEWPTAAEEPERRQLLEVDPREVRFRHELARHAIGASVPAARRRRLHAEILEALLASDADPAEIVHHADAAGAEDIVAAHVLVAARRAASLGSNRQAFAHYQRAAETLDGRPTAEQADVLEELASSAYLASRLDIGLNAIEGAIAAHESVGDHVAVARCTRIRSRLHWYSGDGAAARSDARRAVAILESADGASVDLASAYSAVSQLAMLEEDVAEAIAWGERAIELADRLGQPTIRVHAMINIGTARMVDDPQASAELLEAHELASGLGEHHEAARALVNLAYSLATWVRPRDALAAASRARDYAEAHEVDALSRYARLVMARLQLRAGEWSDVEELVRRGIGRTPGVPDLLGRTILTELASRRGDRDAPAMVADLLVRATLTGEPQRMEPPLEFLTMAALLDGEAPPATELRELLGRLRPGRFRTRVRAWMSVAGLARYPDETADTPHAALARGDWRAAADGFSAAGWSYDAAIAMLLLDDETSLGAALETGRQLGARPLARRAAERLREQGYPVRRGRRAATRANAAGLTAREQDVLELLIEGLTNAEIAGRLVLSRRTAEHHVTAVLGKLGVASRREAARAGIGLGLSGVSGG